MSRSWSGVEDTGASMASVAGRYTCRSYSVAPCAYASSAASAPMPWSERPVGSLYSRASVATARRFCWASGVGYAETQCSSAMDRAPPPTAQSTAFQISVSVLMPVERITGSPVRATWSMSSACVRSPLATLNASRPMRCSISTDARSNAVATVTSPRSLTWRITLS